MWKFIKSLFKKKKVQAKVVPLYPEQEEEFSNVEDFLNNSADLSIKTVSDSKSTLFFKEASGILNNKENLTEDTPEVLALQSFITEHDEERENSDTTMIAEEEEILQNS